MYDLSACNRRLFKTYYCFVLFLLFKSFFKYYEKYFWFHLYLFEKTFLVNKYNKKCVIRRIMYFCKNLLNLDCRDSIRFGICKMKGHLGRVSPSHFLQNVLIEISCVCSKKFCNSYCVLCHFLISWSLEYSKHINRGGICTFKACL